MNRSFWKSRIGSKLILLIMVSLGVSIGMFVLAKFAADRGLDYYFDHSTYLDNCLNRTKEQFQTYITKRKIKSTDTKKIAKWVKNKKVVMISIYKDGYLIYDSTSSTPEDILNNAVQDQFFEGQPYYKIKFKDGQATVRIAGFFEYVYYDYVQIVLLVLSAILFLAIVIWGMRGRMQYINQLEEEISILEGGDLNYEITQKGSDELSSLAHSLDEMRKSMKEKLSQEEEIRLANEELITTMSHDLRTPLTTQMVYLEIIRNHKYKTEEQLFSYLNKIWEKSYQIKGMSDRIFEYFAAAQNEELPELEEPCSAKELMMGMLSDCIFYLEEQGIRVKAELLEEDISIRVVTDYMLRIFDNIVSNFLKYAEKSEPVHISMSYERKLLVIHFMNCSVENTDGIESYRIGIRNIQRMMRQMNGSCTVEIIDRIFKLTLSFPADLRIDQI